MTKTFHELLLIGGLMFYGSIATADETNHLASLKTTEGMPCHLQYLGQTEPVIAFVASAFDVLGVDLASTLAALKYNLDNGCSIEEEDSAGTSPLNVAVLIGSPEMLTFFLDEGADPTKIISRARPYANGKNSYQFAQLLHQLDPTAERAKIVQLLEQTGSQRSNKGSPAPTQ